MDRPGIKGKIFKLEFRDNWMTPKNVFYYMNSMGIKFIMKNEFVLCRKAEKKDRFIWWYNDSKSYSQSHHIYMRKNVYTPEEIKYVDDMFSSLDESHLIMIKALIKSKWRNTTNI